MNILPLPVSEKALGATVDDDGLVELIHLGVDDLASDTLNDPGLHLRRVNLQLRGDSRVADGLRVGRERRKGEEADVLEAGILAEAKVVDSRGVGLGEALELVKALGGKNREQLKEHLVRARVGESLDGGELSDGRSGCGEGRPVNLCGLFSSENSGSSALHTGERVLLQGVGLGHVPWKRVLDRDERSAGSVWEHVRVDRTALIRLEKLGEETLLLELS
mmetsp:Transcript_11746/g.33239  ORF Transcript_11746/g.33239 Transcript_11746/m.33239 type:complete len:220 (-) Transcript_11746:480-1139(-)